MLKVGVDLSGVLTQMKKDNMDKSLIDEFNKSHGGINKENDDDEKDLIKLAEKLGLPKKPQIPKPVNQMKRVK